MAEQECYVGSVGPFLYDDTDLYEDGLAFRAFRGPQILLGYAPSVDNEVTRRVDAEDIADAAITNHKAEADPHTQYVQKSTGYDGNKTVLTDMEGSVTEFQFTDGQLTGFSDSTTFPNIRLTSTGGLAVKLTNRTGASTVKGTLVHCSLTYDNAFDIAPADSYDCVGVVLNSGNANGAASYIVIAGITEVLLKDGTSSTRGNWVKASDTAGRADASGAVPSPPTADAHFKEIGHCLESKTSGTDVLCKIMLHFN